MKDRVRDVGRGKMWELQEETGVSDDEMVSQHHSLSGHEFEQTPRDSGVQRTMACCRSRGRKEVHTT